MVEVDGKANTFFILSWLFLDWTAQGMMMGAQIFYTAASGPLFARVIGPTYAAGMMFGMPLMGKVSDALGRKAGFAADSFLGTAIPSVWTGLLLYYQWESWFHFLALNVLWGFFGCATSVCEASISDITEKSLRAKWNGYLLATMFCGMSVGFGVSASFDPTGQPVVCYAAAGTSCFAGIYMLIFVKETRDNEAARGVEVAGDGDGKVMTLGSMLENKALLLMFCVTWLQFFSYSIFESDSVQAIARVWGENGPDKITNGGVVAALFACTLLGPVVKCVGVRIGLAGGLGVRGIAFVLFAACWGVEYIPDTAWCLVMIGIQVIDATGSAFLATLMPSKNRGLAIGLNKACGAFGRMVGPFTGLSLFSKGGIWMQVPFYISGVASVVAVLIVLFGIKEIDRVMIARDPTKTLLSNY